MNERYLFRAKRLDNGVWVQGAYAYVTFWGDDVIIEQPPAGNGIFCLSRDPVDVDSATVGQCTGLRDKNGRLIFEGDTLKASVKGEIEEVPVCWDHGMWCAGDGEFAYPLADFLAIELEIVGNIHEGWGKA